jgi:hypothetical protein
VTCDEREGRAGVGGVLKKYCHFTPLHNELVTLFIFSTIKKQTKKQKSSYSISALAIKPPPRQHLNFSHFKTDAFKKGTVHKRCHRPIKDLKFSP